MQIIVKYERTNALAYFAFLVEWRSKETLDDIGTWRSPKKGLLLFMLLVLLLVGVLKTWTNDFTFLFFVEKL